jgi:hypothetical protein
MDSKDVNKEKVNKLDNYNGRVIYIKTQNIIKNAKIQKYAKEGCELANEGITFFGGITGKNALKLERLKNIKLRIELLQSQKIEEKDVYEAQDMMADIYASAISELGGKFTKEMQNMYDKIKCEYAENDVTDEKVYELACKKIVGEKSYLPIIHQEKTKGIFGDTKAQTDFYKLENKKLENQIILERGKSQFNTFLFEGKDARNYNTNKC